MNNPTYPHPVPQAPQQSVTPRRKRRVFLWVFLAIQVLFIVWLAGGIASSAGDAAAYCHANASPYVSYQSCVSLHNAGTGLGAAAIVVFWVVVDILVGGGYAIYRLASRR